MKIEKTVNEEAVVLTFPEGYASGVLTEELKEIDLEKLERNTLIVDFSNTTHIGSLIFGWLSKVYKTLKKDNKKAIIVGNKKVDKIFEQMGFIRYFKIIK